jgi:hypothetical protein
MTVSAQRAPIARVLLGPASRPAVRSTLAPRSAIARRRVGGCGGSGGEQRRLEYAAERLAQLVWRVGCDRVEAKRQERREDRGVVDGAGRDAEPGGSEVADQRAGEEEVLDADAVQADVPRPGGECAYAVLGDDHQPRAEAELGGELACAGPETDDLGPLPRRVV